ncbi:MAG: L-threonylcarbamoyladenylate synthase [Dehalococcoidia bacterium]
MGSNEDAVSRAAEVLRAGGLVVMPTDTVYGVAARADEPSAIDRLFKAKGRRPEKALPILVASLVDAAVIADLTPLARRLAETFWPGPLTIVVPARAGFDSPALAGGRTIGLRMPDNHVALGVIAAAGGRLAVSSANRSDGPNPLTVEEARSQLGNSVSLYIDGGQAAGETGSTIVDCTGEAPKILREGPISAAEIAAAAASA